MLSFTGRRFTGVLFKKFHHFFITRALFKEYGEATMSEKSEYPPIEDAVRKALSRELNPVYMEVINESPMHNTPKKAESHFRVFVVSEKFNNLTLIKRHRLVNDTIKTALIGAGLQFMHALSIETLTPTQWKPEQLPEKSPPCMGGFGK
ncbi:bolA-like protein DDB_G0274169 [Drosophila busckii]|nr:bolA-like protein DDB_G0274169 [Drosophila busckii]